MATVLHLPVIPQDRRAAVPDLYTKAARLFARAGISATETREAGKSNRALAEAAREMEHLR